MKLSALTPTKRMPFPEFIVFCAMMFATVAYSTDSMLALFVPMVDELAPDTPDLVQLVIPVFMLGLGVGTFVMGPISDALGRKSVILGGIVLYMIAAMIAANAENMTVLLAARFIQGLGAAGPRVVSQALIRDQYAGRQMARVVSLAMTVFVIFPALAPFIGAQIGEAYGWRAIFYSFLVFGTVSGLWLLLRQPETLPPENRRSLHFGPVVAAFAEVFRNRLVMMYLAALTCAFATMMVWLSTVSLICHDVYDRLDSFPMWFAIVAVLSMPASLINAALVVRLGMRRLIITAFVLQLLLALSVLALTLLMPALPFWMFVAFMAGHFFTVGLLFGNLNALALEPLGHVAGTASSVMGGVSTMLAAVVGAPLATLYDGTLVPLTLSVIGCAVLGAAMMIVARRIAPVRPSKT